MVYSIAKHILRLDGKPVAQRPSPNRGGALKPSLLVLHFTGGDSAAGAIATLTSQAAKVSAHIVVDQAGAVTQLLPFNIVGWHAGASSWKGKSGCNAFSVGIEMVNAGPLLAGADGKYRTEIGKRVVAPSQVVHAKHRVTGADGYWAAYPDAQIAAVIEIGRAICDAYKIVDVAGHEDIAPKRKVDPGPAFPLLRVAGAITGRK